MMTFFMSIDLRILSIFIFLILLKTSSKTLSDVLHILSFYQRKSTTFFGNSCVFLFFLRFRYISSSTNNSLISTPSGRSVT